MNDEIKNKLKQINDEGVIILGVGNQIKGDDAFGSLLAELLIRNTKLTVYETGTAPENFAFKIAESDTKNILILDALDFNGIPGEIRFINPDELEKSPLPMTHGPSLELMTNILFAYGKTVYFLGVQPKSTEYNANISDEVKISIDVILNFLKSL